MTLLSADWGSVIAYVRPAAMGGDPVLVILNFGPAAEPTIEPDPALDEILRAGELEDALTGGRHSFAPGRPLKLTMPAHSVRILVPAGASS
jgi:hypothetical protein